MDLTLGKFIVWLIVGGLAGTLAARVIGLESVNVLGAIQFISN
jgi:uncharacterized membrane protein YeaQ/YmgE (transglycosylase-associated protein family)